MAATALGAVKALLVADAGVTELVEPECIISLEDGAAPVSPSASPALYEARAGSGVPALKTCIVLGLSTAVPVRQTGIHVQQFMKVTIYDENDYLLTAAVLERVWLCLDGGWEDGAVTTLDDGRTLTIRFVDEPIRQSLDQSVVAAGTVKGAVMEQARYRLDMRAKGAIDP